MTGRCTRTGQCPGSPVHACGAVYALRDECWLHGPRFALTAGQAPGWAEVMVMEQQAGNGTPLAMRVRRLWPDRNPLRRAADRAEFAVAALLPWRSWPACR